MVEALVQKTPDLEKPNLEMQEGDQDRVEVTVFHLREARWYKARCQQLRAERDQFYQYMEYYKKQAIQTERTLTNQLLEGLGWGTFGAIIGGALVYAFMNGAK